MESSPKLKPCPFCGGTDFEICIYRVPLCAYKHEKTGIQADVCCKTCFYERGVLVSVHTRHATDRKPKESWARCEARARADAAVAWNRRAGEEAKNGQA